MFYNIKFIKTNFGTIPTISFSFYKYIFVTISNPCKIIYREIQRKFNFIYIKNILHIFVTGYSECKNIVYEEYNHYKDILILSTKNHYFNITSYFIQAVTWIDRNIKYNYIIKWYDDIIINLPLFQFFINLKNNEIHYGGFIYNSTKICRNKKNICYVPFKIYRYITIPSFSASGMLILSSITVKLILHNIQYF